MLVLTLSIALPVSAKNKSKDNNNNKKTSIVQGPPKLVLQITIDQLRGDLPFRYRDRFSKGGFNYLLNNGAVFKNAHHSHANTETIVGHVTLATGAHPSSHGLIGNIWYDRQAKTTVYNIEDPNYLLLTKGGDVNKKTEVDPTQKAASVDGRSPHSINASTFSDEMKVASAGKAKIFAVSVKDRGAVSMAGHGGKAFWFSKASQDFVSSSYYYDQYPQWVNQWNDKNVPASYGNKHWTLLHEKEGYVFAEHDDKPWEADLGGYGRVFPHPFGDSTSKYFSTLLTISPVGDKLTVDFAKSLVTNEGIGKDSITDYLSISLSSTDYVGHFYGLSSLESEDNLLQLDRTLEDLFQFIDNSVGLENTLIVLSSDHGGPEAPGFLHEHDLKGEYVDAKDWDALPQIKRLKAKLGLTKPLIKGYHHPYIYLDHEILSRRKLDLENVQQQVADSLVTLKDVHRAVTSKSIEKGQLANTQINRLVANNYYAGRSGDVYLIFEPQDFINDLDGLVVPSVHGSPWSYDTFVPVIFSGMNIPASEVYQRIDTTDIAPTMSALLNIKPPTASEGRVLEQVFK